MSMLLGDLPNCNIYMDDVIIYSSTWADHISTLYNVFGRFATNYLSLKPIKPIKPIVKCEFAKASATHLGKKVGNREVRPVEAKLNAIIAYPVPTKRQELQRFLGMTGYCRWFCKNFLTVVTPLTKLCSPNVFNWTEECRNAFLCAKSLLCSAPVFSPPEMDHLLRLVVDAGLGAILFQDGADGLSHPLSYFSAKFSRHQMNYFTI